MSLWNLPQYGCLVLRSIFISWPGSGHPATVPDNEPPSGVNVRLGIVTRTLLKSGPTSRSRVLLACSDCAYKDIFRKTESIDN